VKGYIAHGVVFSYLASEILKANSSGVIGVVLAALAALRCSTKSVSISYCQKKNPNTNKHFQKKKKRGKSGKLCELNCNPTQRKKKGGVFH